MDERRNEGTETRTDGSCGRLVERRPVSGPSKMSEQAAVVTWWRFACRKYGVPEEALLRVSGEGEPPVPNRSLRRQGARCGAADLFLAVPRGRSFGLWLSLRRRGRNMTPEEKEFFSSMTRLGYDAALCRSRDEAKERIHAYMVHSGETYQKNVS